MVVPDGKLPSLLLYGVLCHVLSERSGQIDWLAFDTTAWEAFVSQAKAEGVDQLILASIMMPSIIGIVSIILVAFLSSMGNLDNFLANCTIVLAFPVLCGFSLSSLHFSRHDFNF